MYKSLVSICFIWIVQGLAAQDLVFKDENFRKAVLAYEPEIDVNKDGIIQKSEADSVSNLWLMDKDIRFVDDAYLFPNLVELVLTNNHIEQVRLVGFQKLEKFSCAASHVLQAELRDLPRLTHFAFNFNQIDTIILSNLPQLQSYYAEGNQLRAVNLEPHPLLKYVSVRNNKLTELDISKNFELIQVNVEVNGLTELDIRNNPGLKTSILYIDEKEVKIIATEEQQKAIEENGLGQRIQVKD